MSDEERRNFIKKNLRELTSSTEISSELGVSLLALSLIENSEFNLFMDKRTPNIDRAIMLYTQTMNKWEKSQLEDFKRILKETGNYRATNILENYEVQMLRAQGSVQSDNIIDYNKADADCMTNVAHRSNVSLNKELSPKSTDVIQVVIQVMGGQRYNIPEVRTRKLVNALKKTIQGFTGISPEDQTLIYLGQELVDDNILSEYIIEKGCVINLIPRSVGGAIGSTFLNPAIGNKSLKTITVTIQDLEGREYNISGVKPEQNVNELKQKIQGFTEISPADQTLMFLGQELIDDTILSEYGVVDGCMINMVLRSVGGGGRKFAIEIPFNQPSSSKSTTVMLITIMDLEGREYDISGVKAQQNVNELKQKIQGFTGIPLAEQTLMYLGQELVDDTLLSEYGIVDGCMIYVVERSVGGGGRRNSDETQFTPASSNTTAIKMTVIIQDLEGRLYDVAGSEVEQSVNKLKQKICELTGVSPADQTLMYNNWELVGDTCLSEHITADRLMIKMANRPVENAERSTSNETLCNPASSDKSRTVMTVHIQDLEGRMWDVTGIEAEQNANKLKQKIYGITGVIPADQTLLYLGQELLGDTPLFEYGVIDECMINMVHRSIGGGGGGVYAEIVLYVKS